MRGSKINTAIEFLINHITGKEVSSGEIYGAAKMAGISRRTLERAKLELGVRSVQLSDGWVWVLDKQNDKDKDVPLVLRQDLPAIYFKHQKQVELAVVEIHEPHFPKEEHPLDISKLKRIFLICGLSKFHGKFDSFSLRVPNEMEGNIAAGDAFVFCNWSKTQISILQWQGDGFAQYFKRSDYGQFPWPPKRYAQAVEIMACDLKILLEYPRFMLRLSGAILPENSRGKMAENIDFA